MTGQPLATKQIWITRPQAQAEALAQMITTAGGQITRLPTMTIKPITNSPRVTQSFNQLGAGDSIIFISVNAVDVMFKHYLTGAKQLSNIQVFAIGATTAQRLSDNGVRRVHHGCEGNTESLLKSPLLQAMQDKNVLIVRGLGGRGKLALQLKRRGANINYAAVYQRCLPNYSEDKLKTIWQKAPDAIITTSNNGLKNLVKLTLKDNQQQLLKTPLVVMSVRAKDLAHTMGFNAKVAVATKKNDHALWAALLTVFGD